MQCFNSDTHLCKKGRKQKEIWVITVFQSGCFHSPELEDRWQSDHGLIRIRELLIFLSIALVVISEKRLIDFILGASRTDQTRGSHKNDGHK